MIKRAFDFAASALGPAAAQPRARHGGAGSVARGWAAGAVPAGAHRPRWAAVSDAEIPQHGEGRRRPRTLLHARDVTMHHARGPLHPPHESGRAAAAHQRAQGRDRPRRTAPRPCRRSKACAPEDWALRCNVRPGLTGLAQALYRSDCTERERLEADLRYVPRGLVRVGPEDPLVDAGPAQRSGRRTEHVRHFWLLEPTARRARRRGAARDGAGPAAPRRRRRHPPRPGARRRGRQPAAVHHRPRGRTPTLRP